MVAVDQILDRLVGDLLYLVDILLPAGRPAVGDRIGGDHAVVGDDEHRLMVAVAEDVDVVGAVDLFGLDLWPLRLCRRRRLLRLRCRYGQGRYQRGRHSCEIYPRHGVPPWFSGDGASLARSAVLRLIDDTISEVFRHSDARNLAGVPAKGRPARPLRHTSAGGT